MVRRPNFLAADAPPAPPLVRTHGGRRTLEFTPGDIQSEMLLSRPDTLVLAYTRAMMAFVLFVPRPRHILMVGLGGGSLVKFCHRHFPDCRITVIELRADVIALRDAFLVPPDDARLRVVHGDAVEVMHRLAARGEPCADVVLVDGFDPDGLPAALADAAFYRDCRAVLREGGVLAANVFTYDARYASVLAALDTVFDGCTCWFDKVAGNNRIVFGLRAAHADLPAARLQARIARRHGFGAGLLNRLATRLLLMRIAWRTVLGLPHWGKPGSEL